MEGNAYDQRRQEVLAHLSEVPVCSSELARRAGISRNAAKRALDYFMEHRLVKARRIYSPKVGYELTMYTRTDKPYVLARGRSRKLKPYPLKRCKQCGNGIIPRLVNGLREGPRNYQRRTYCGPACRGLSQRREVPVKHCKQCGEPFGRKTYEGQSSNGHGRYESPGEYAKRKTCSEACRDALGHRQRKPDAPKPQREARPKAEVKAEVKAKPSPAPWVSEGETMRHFTPPSLETYAPPPPKEGARCPVHPDEVLGVFGCGMCAASARRRRIQDSRRASTPLTVE